MWVWARVRSPPLQLGVARWFWGSPHPQVVEPGLAMPSRFRGPEELWSEARARARAPRLRPPLAFSGRLGVVVGGKSKGKGTGAGPTEVV